MNIEDVRVGMWVIHDDDDIGQVRAIDSLRHNLLVKRSGGEIWQAPPEQLRPLTLADLKAGDLFTFTNSGMVPDDLPCVASGDGRSRWRTARKWDAYPLWESWTIPGAPGRCEVSLVLDEPADELGFTCLDCSVFFADERGNGIDGELRCDECHRRHGGLYELPAIGSRWTISRNGKTRHVEVIHHDDNIGTIVTQNLISLETSEVGMTLWEAYTPRPFVDPYTGSEWELLAEYDGIHWQPATCAEYSIARRDLPNPNAPRPEPVVYWSGEYADEGGV